LFPVWKFGFLILGRKALFHNVIEGFCISAKMS